MANPLGLLLRPECLIPLADTDPCSRASVSPNPVDRGSLRIRREILVESRANAQQIKVGFGGQRCDVFVRCHRDVRRVLRIVTVLPVDLLVEFIKILLAALATLEHVAPPVALFYQRIQ